jgi:hypothetical protein
MVMRLIYIDRSGRHEKIILIRCMVRALCISSTNYQAKKTRAFGRRLSTSFTVVALTSQTGGSLDVTWGVDGQWLGGHFPSLFFGSNCLDFEAKSEVLILGALI